jgi:formate-dependent phosphoribosylglycinamide formyltransferase (GAR transformylase)
MHILFVEPSFPFNQREFVRALHAVGARVTGIGEAPVEALQEDVKSWLYGYEQVPSVVHEESLMDAVRRVQQREWVDRLEATIEAHILPTAKVREGCSIPGTSVRTAFLCRDKPAMKEALREGGVPCAASLGTDSVKELHQFIEEIGFPVILKPRDAAGAAGATRVDNAEELAQAIHEAGLSQGHSIAVEEFVEGHEGFYDTLCIDGQTVHDFVCHYYPNVLTGMRERWISPQVITTNRLDQDSYVEVKELGDKVNAILGIGTSATHMEWFFGDKGLKFSEIGCRPPGVGAWDLYCAAHEIDLYQEWARAIDQGTIAEQRSRRFSAGMIALRPEQDGVISGYSGVEKIEQAFGDCIIDTHFPAPGTPTQPVEAGFMANAWMRLRHPDYDRLREILDTVGETVKVHAR